MTIERLEPKADNFCFGCGAANAGGMKLAFSRITSGGKLWGAFALASNIKAAGG